VLLQVLSNNQLAHVIPHSHIETALPSSRIYRTDHMENGQHDLNKLQLQLILVREDDSQIDCY
jgi:hypothetical protein